MKICIALTFLIMSSLVFCQKKQILNDSEYLILEEKSRIYLNNDIDSSYKYSEVIEKSNNHLHKSFANALKAYISQIKGKNKLADKYFLNSLNNLNKVPTNREKTRIHALIKNYAGLISWKRHDLKKAYREFLNGKKLSESISDRKQVIIFNNNISLIQNEIGNYKKAIEILHESKKLISKSEYSFSKEKLSTTLSNINLQLGVTFENAYYNDTSKKKLIDSALYYYKKSLNYSNNLLDNKLTAQSNMATIYKVKKDFVNAEKLYINLLELTNNYKYESKHYNIAYNLGDLYFEQKKFDKALIFFNKVDSIYKLNPLNDLEFINTNYYLAKIYENYNNEEKALEYSKLYLVNFEKYESEMSEAQKEVNYLSQNNKFKKNMKAIQKKYKYSKTLQYSSISGLFFIIFILIFLLMKNINEKREITNKIEDVIKQFEFKKEIITSSSKNSTTLNIDSDKETEIIQKLILLEKKMFYLTQDFTLQNTAKKIKTNTTYLSYVVNKHYNKTFSEYANELKISHVINQLINNPTYRKYSTQAIAESVGFKNAISFTKSFSKRVGMSPTQFIKGINSESK